MSDNLRQASNCLQVLLARGLYLKDAQLAKKALVFIQKEAESQSMASTPPKDAPRQSPEKR